MNNSTPRAASVGDYLLTTSRQVWLASLGAAVVTRDWAEKEAGHVFRNLVREGTAIESRAIRFVGDRIETSFTQANMMWKRARRNVTTTVKAYADTAAMLVRETLPASLPKMALTAGEPAPKRRAIRAQKAVAKRTTAAAKRVKRSVKAATKRG